MNLFYKWFLLANATPIAPSGITEYDNKITFSPDYSAIIKDECTYLVISAQTYLSAIRSTLITRDKRLFKDSDGKETTEMNHRRAPSI